MILEAGGIFRRRKVTGWRCIDVRTGREIRDVTKVDTAARTFQTYVRNASGNIWVVGGHSGGVGILSRVCRARHIHIARATRTVLVLPTGPARAD